MPLKSGVAQDDRTTVFMAINLGEEEAEKN